MTWQAYREVKCGQWLERWGALCRGRLAENHLQPPQSERDALGGSSAGKRGSDPVGFGRIWGLSRIWGLRALGRATGPVYTP